MSKDAIETKQKSRVLLDALANNVNCVTMRRKCIDILSDKMPRILELLPELSQRIMPAAVSPPPPLVTAVTATIVPNTTTVDWLDDWERLKPLTSDPLPLFDDELLKRTEWIKENEALLDQGKVDLAQREAVLMKNEALLNQTKLDLALKEDWIKESEVTLQQNKVDLAQREAALREKQKNLEELCKDITEKIRAAQNKIPQEVQQAKQMLHAGMQTALDQLKNGQEKCDHVLEEMEKLLEVNI